MILNSDEIWSLVYPTFDAKESIHIYPFDRSCLGVNSYDVHLAPKLIGYTEQIVDPTKENRAYEFEINDSGSFVLYPGIFFLGSIVEDIMTNSNRLIPMIEGVSSLARLGLSIHQTAGFGDIGFSGKWTLELSCLRPIVLRAGMRIAQVYWERCEPCSTVYDGHYTDNVIKSSQEWRRSK